MSTLHFACQCMLAFLMFAAVCKSIKSDVEGTPEKPPEDGSQVVRSIICYAIFILIMVGAGAFSELHL